MQLTMEYPWSIYVRNLVMFELQKKRLRFHIRRAVSNIRYKLKIFTKEEKIFFDSIANIDKPDDQTEEDEELKAFLTSIEDALDKTIDFDPKRTVLFRGKHGRRCNFLTVRKYREEIVVGAVVLLMSGIDTFIVDYISPFGLAALEKLVEMREKGYYFKLYAIQDGPISSRKTYRFIPEIGSEIILLADKCDKHLLPSPAGNAIKKVYRDVLRIFDEDGISINPLVILEDEDLENTEFEEMDLKK